MKEKYANAVVLWVSIIVIAIAISSNESSIPALFIRVGMIFLSLGLILLRAL